MKDTGERMIPEHHQGMLMYGEHLVRYNAVLPIVKDKIVLDVASGTGYGSQLMAKTANQVYGVDVSKEAVEYAQKKFPAPNLEFKQGDATKIPLEDSSVDVVVSFETIEHLKEYVRFVDEVKRVLKPNGVFVVSTPNEEEYQTGNDFHVHEFEVDEFKDLLAKKFKNYQLYYQGAYISSGLLQEKDFTSLWSKQLEVSKDLTQPADAVTYLVAVCSDESLPTLEERISLATPWSDRGHAEYIDKYENEIKDLKSEVKDLRNHIDSIEHSNSWRITKPLRAIRKTKK